MPEEVDQIKKLKKRIKDLERALLNAQTDKVITESYFELLCEQKGITDVAGYKKKSPNSCWKKSIKEPGYIDKSVLPANLDQSSGVQNVWQPYKREDADPDLSF